MTASHAAYLGQAAYEAYFMARDGDTGQWHELTDDQRAAWEAAAAAAIDASGVGK